MLNNFIYAETKDLFLDELNAGNVLDEAIVFIADTKEIWNHGTYFAGPAVDQIARDAAANATTIAQSKGSGTITGVSANGTSVATSGVANIPAASTSKYGVTKLTSSTSSTSEVLAATAKAIKTVYDLADGKWTYNEATIKAVKVNNAGYADSAGSATDQTARDAAATAQSTANGKWTYNADTIKAVKVNSASNADSAKIWTNTPNLNVSNADSIDNVCGWMNNSTGSTGMPVNAGTIMQFGSGTTGKVQLFGGYKSDSEASPHGLYYRKYYNSKWDSWKEIMAIDNAGNLCTTQTKNLITSGSFTGSCYYGGTKGNAGGVNSTGMFRWGTFDTTGGLMLQFGASSGSKFEIVNSSWTNALFAVDTDGKTSALGGFYETSDERLKDFSESIPVDFEKLKKLKKNYFTWKDSNNTDIQIGVSAQEIKEIYPEIVSEGSDGKLQVAYDKLSVVALAAIDKLEDRVKVLEEKLEMLVNKLG